MVNTLKQTRDLVQRLVEDYFDMPLELREPPWTWYDEKLRVYTADDRSVKPMTSQSTVPVIRIHFADDNKVSTKAMRRKIPIQVEDEEASTILHVRRGLSILAEDGSATALSPEAEEIPTRTESETEKSCYGLPELISQFFEVETKLSPLIENNNVD